MDGEPNTAALSVPGRCQKAFGKFFRLYADHRFAAVSQQTDFGATIVKFHHARTTVCPDVVKQRAISVDTKADPIAGIEAQHTWEW